jgi:hypothetical protein
MRATKSEMVLITEQMNPEGSNYKDVNFVKIISKDENGIRAEVGYWITYVGCKPKYNKEVRFFKLPVTSSEEGE